MPVDRNRLNASPLFKHFWKGTHPGLTHEGLDEVNRAGAEELERYAREHDDNGNVSPPGQQTIEPAEREIMAAILEDETYGSLFELDARPVITSKFGLDAGTLHLPTTAVRPAAAGAIKLPERVSRFSATTLEEKDIRQLGAAFTREYEMRKAYFEDPMLETEEKGSRVLGLLRDYAKALWSHGQMAHTAQAGKELLNRYWAMPYSEDVGRKDFNGSGFSAAQGLVLNIDPFELKHSFPEAKYNSVYTYLAMDGKMAGAMKYVDDYLRAKGVSNPSAEAFEKRSVLGFLLDQETGHTKAGSLNERRPFATSGLNWGLALFPGDAEVAALPPRADFEFPLDVVDGHGDLVYVGKNARIEVKDKDGNDLTVEKEIQKNAQGTPISWSAKFKAADGREVPAAEAFGRVIDGLGLVKGDGKFDGTNNMAWWGFCDLNTAQQVFKARFKIPQLDRETIKVKAGNQTLSIPRAEAQALIDADIRSITGSTGIGFRFDGEAQHVRLKDRPTTLVGKVAEDVMRYGSGTRRIEGDTVLISNTQEEPIVGSLLVENGKADPYVDVRLIDTVTDLGNGNVDIKLKHFDRYGRTNVSGKLADALSFSQAPLVDGKRVLKQDDALSIRGALTVTTRSGKKTRIAVDQVESIQSEMKTEMRFTEYLAYVARNEGVYATDAAVEPAVSNGMRWVNKIELDEKKDGTRPAWVGDRPLSGLQGDLKLNKGDTVVFGRALFKSEWFPDLAANFTGWYQVRDGRIINEGFISGEPDFAWGPGKTMNWLAPSGFNRHMDPQLRVSLMVNGIKDMNDALASRLNLPSDWKSYQVPQ